MVEVVGRSELLECLTRVLGLIARDDDVRDSQSTEYTFQACYDGH